MNRKKRYVALLMALAVFASQVFGSTLGVSAEEPGAQMEETVTASLEEPEAQASEETAAAPEAQASEETAAAPEEMPADVQEEALAEDEVLIGDDEIAADADALTEPVDDPTAPDEAQMAPEAGEDSLLVVEEATVVSDPMLAEEEAPQEGYHITGIGVEDDYTEIYRGADSCMFKLQPPEGQTLEGKMVDWQFGVWTEDDSWELDEQFAEVYTVSGEYGEQIAIDPGKIPMDELRWETDEQGTERYSFQIQAVISDPEGSEEIEPAFLWVDVRWDDNHSYYFSDDQGKPLEENYTDVYVEGESYTFCLSSDLEDPYAGRNVNWNLGFWDGDEFMDLGEDLADACEIAEDQKAITVDPAKIPLDAVTRINEEGDEITAFQIWVSISPEGDPKNEISSAILWVNVAEAGDDRSALPGEDSRVVLGDEFYIEPGYNIFAWDAENPDGTEFWYEVTGVEVAYPDGNADVLSYYAEEEEKWIDASKATITQGDCGLRANQPGAADVELTLSCEGREDIVYPFTITVVGDLYNLEIPDPNNGYQMAFGGELTIPSSLAYRRYDVNYDEPIEESVPDYELEVTGCEYGEEYFTVKPEGHEIKVTCGPCEDMDEAGLKFFVAAKIDGVIVAENEVYVNAFRGYFELLPESAENIERQLGETYEIKPKLVYYQDGEPIDLTEKAEFFVTYDGWDEESGMPFGEFEEGRLYADENGTISLTRQTPAWGTVRLYVEYDPGEEEIGYPFGFEDGPTQYFNFQGLDYGDFGIEDAWMDRTLFIGDEEALTLKAENVPEGEGYQVRWECLRYPEGDGEPEDVSDAVDVVTDGNSVTLRTTGEQFTEDNAYFHVRAVLFYGDPENGGIELASGEEEVFVSVEEPGCGLECADVMIGINQRVPFPYEEKLGGYVGQVYLRNSRYPNGAFIPVLLNDLKLESEDPDAPAAELIAPTDEDDCYYVHALEEGGVTVTCTVSQAKGQEFDEAWKDFDTMHFYVSSEPYEEVSIEDVWTEGTRASEYLLPTEKAQIVFRLLHLSYDEEQGKMQREYFLSNELPEGYKLDVSYEVNDGGQDLLTVSKDGVITPNGGRGDAGIVLHATLSRGEDEFPLTDEEGWGFDIHVTGIYYSLQLDNPLYVEPGGKVAIPEKVMEYSMTSPNGKESSNEVEWSIGDYDDGLMTVSDDGTTLQIEDIPQDDQPLVTEVYFNIWGLRGDAYWYRQEVVICRHELQEEVTTAPTCVAAGVRTSTCTRCGYTKQEEIPAVGHDFGEWVKVADATTTTRELQQRTCKNNCGTVETRYVGELLSPAQPAGEAPFIRLNVQKLPLKVKQSTKAVRVEMAAGDSIVSWTSSNKKIAKVNAKGKITGKKKGKATITVTLASGLTASVKITVQTPAVRTKKIKGVEKKLTLAKDEKHALSPELTPLTSQDRITYTSSNQKVATVDKKGNITAKGKGTAKITVKSGKKKAVCTVTVK